MEDRVPIVQLDTGVPGLNEILGGGLPEYSFNLLAGGPGAGKTTLAQQMCFALATPQRPALYITVLGEPPIKVLRYQQQFAFFDSTKVNHCLRFVSIPAEALEGGLDEVFGRIVAEVEAYSPGLVVVDTFRSVIRAAEDSPRADFDLQAFVQRLALQLTAWQATTFLLGEYHSPENQDHPIFTIADGTLWLYQSVERNAVVRKMQVIKMRGQTAIPGLHAFRITKQGVQVFPRLPIPGTLDELGVRHGTSNGQEPPRLSTGVRGLDDMMGGGVWRGSSLLVSGPSGSGKTVLAMQFLAEGANRGEPGLLAIFEKRPADYLHTNPLGNTVARHIRAGTLRVLKVGPLDGSLEETLVDLRAEVEAHGIKRVVIDSLSGLELALAPGFREDFRETLHRMVTMLTALGITLIMTMEIADSYGDLSFNAEGTAFLTDGILLQRYVELEGELQRVCAIVKLRGSQHSKELRLYEVREEGVVIGDPLKGYEGIITGLPHRVTK